MTPDPPLSLRSHVAGQSLVVVTMSVFAAAAVYAGCTHASQPVPRPEQGTARAGYCAAVNGGAPWFLFIAVPLASLALWFAPPAARRRPASGWFLVLGWILALLALLVIANTLAYTIPFP